MQLSVSDVTIEWIQMRITCIRNDKKNLNSKLNPVADENLNVAKTLICRLIGETTFSEIKMLVTSTFFSYNRAYFFRYSEYSERVLDQWNISEQCAVFFRTCSGCSK